MNNPGTVDLLTAELREMKLPQVFKTGSGVNHGHDFRLATLACSVVHDGHPRLNRVYQHCGVRLRLPVMGHHEKIHSANLIVRTHQIEFLLADRSPRSRARNLPNAMWIPID